MRRLRNIILLGIFISILVFTVPFWSEKLIGERPNKEFQPTVIPKAKKTDLKDSETLKLIKEVEQDPENIELRRALLKKLDTLYLQSGEVALQMDIVDQLSVILKKIPDDPEANFKLAEISFNAQVFDKALERYQIYLKRKPEDNYARLRLASAKIFTGKFEPAIADLDLVLTEDPQNFSALAYKSIALAQTGEIESARNFGEQAYKAAPDNEGRERFKRFLDSLSATPQTAAGTWEENLSNHIKNNPIAGSKFVRLEVSGKTLKLYFKDFPAENMPPFARDKFLAGIREHWDPKSVSNIELVDEPSKRVMLSTEN